MKGHFHLAQRKGYSGVGLYARAQPSELRLGFGSREFDAEGRYVEARFDNSAAQAEPDQLLLSERLERRRNARLPSSGS